MRVIAGRLGGRRLAAPNGRGTRPTSDRVREAIFSILADVSGARVLDLYAGTGAMGIEALSRGAESALFVESAARAAAVTKQNLAALGLGAVSRVIGSPVQRSVAGITAAGPFDLAFVDPPYAEAEAATEVLAGLVAGGAFAEGARIVLEHAAAMHPTRFSDLVAVTSERRYGDTAVTFYEVGAGPR
jgi:16S rRNA (guanine966-N2)-methyltransferase